MTICWTLFESIKAWRLAYIRHFLMIGKWMNTFCLMEASFRKYIFSCNGWCCPQRLLRLFDIEIPRRKFVNISPIKKSEYTPKRWHRFDTDNSTDVDKTFQIDEIWRRLRENKTKQKTLLISSEWNKNLPFHNFFIILFFSISPLRVRRCLLYIIRYITGEILYNSLINLLYLNHFMKASKRRVK